MATARHVFVLGAGFSTAVNSAMPTVKGLTEPLDALLKGEAAPMAGLARHLRFKSGDPEPDVEALLTSLATPQPFLDEPGNLLNEALFVAVSGWLARLIFEREREASGAMAPWLKPLAEKWASGPTSHVVTLNYDTLVESAAAGLNPLDSRTDPTGPAFFVDPRSPVEWWGPAAKLLKLHGSLDWLFPGPRYAPTSSFEWASDGPTTATWEQFEARSEGLVPLVVPPVLSKVAYFEHPLVRKAWLEARLALEAATCVVVMGYSLPAADLQMRLLLAEGTRKKPLVLVDQNSDLDRHFEKMLYEPSEIVPTFLGGHDAIERFETNYLSAHWKEP